ncbi:MAG: hypothetical protein GKS00_06285 [Alphaproteobacteria bacterium]|nr:hypothetical protein [Alphaproteobacteria bacterium]
MLKFLTKLIFVAMLVTPYTASGAGVPDGGVLDFAVLRNGSKIGHHVIRFERSGDPMIVRIEAQIDYRLAFIPLYLFQHVSREEWRDGRLVGMVAETNDNGDDYHIEVKPDGSELSLSINGEETPIDPEMVPASLWNIALVKRGSILDPADGDLMKVAIRDSGEEVIEVRGQEIRARRYVMTGDFERDLWYDKQSILVQVRFKGRDGSEIRYSLR